MKQTSLFDTYLGDDLRSSRVHALTRRVGRCTKCSFCTVRKQALIGDVPEVCKVALIGEAPSQTDDDEARLFSGLAEPVVDAMISDLELTRDEVYLGNALACRPQSNRRPEYEELQNCRAHLDAQLEIVSPKVILLMGISAAKALLKTPQQLDTLRGEWFFWRRIPVRVTYHPLYVRRARNIYRTDVREDLKAVRERLEILG